ncbi:MARTX multifunctional-autoprocessing repeats-in-toxin holotoxin RtxA [Vibrio vulnificus]|uniref:MARTX multifunctional-autoprocessing repeats-in-toxin holotoxin RtxA n=1 Tax=Vibrio vulnificus TaxID=672 RepID=UPI000D731303|nr:MARTX multifunctional-autoprocessing repeats-in-toxin holotoxin RtxA [Vibrio vulnificus]PWY28105.1 MARTX multifunctional-autoprocessing repeats-in-toxin holotoxin RtxA [Vibrio vulnificus]
MGKPFWRSVEYFFTGNYSADDGNNSIVAIGFGGEIHAYGGDDHVTVGSIGAAVYTGSGNDTVVGGSAYLRVEDTTGHLSVKGAAGYADINKSGDGNVSFAGAAGGVSIDHLGNHGDVSYGGAAAYNGITRKGLSGNVTFKGAGGYNALWHETNQGNLSFAGAGAGNKLDRTWFNRYQGSRGDVTFDGAGAANSISSRVETGNITFRGAGADNHLVRKGKVGDITLQGAGASNRIERTRQAEDVYAQTRGNIRFEGVGGYNSLYSDVAHGDIHFSGGGAYNTITRKGSGSSFDAQGMEYAKAEDIVLTAAQMHGLSIDNGNKFHAVTAVKSEREPNTYLFAIADGTYTKINKVRLYNDPETGKLKYYSEAWFKRGNHLAELARSDVSSAGGFEVNPINGGYTLSNIAVEHQQSVTVHAVENNLTEYEWVTYGNGVLIDAKDVALSDAKMGGDAIYADGTKVDVEAVKSNRKPNTYVYAKVLGRHTKIVVVELANDPKTGALKYQARSWYKEGNHTANLANEDISSANGYHSMGKGGYSLSDLHYSVNAVRSTSETVADIDEYTDQTLFKPATDSGESSGDVRFNGAGGGNVIKSNVTRGNVYFNGGGIANVILHSSQFGHTEFNGGGAANVIVKSGEEGDLTFHGAGLANVLVHQSKQGKMDVYAGGAVNVLVRIGDGQYLAHLLAYGNISVHKGNGNSRVVMLGGYNTHTQIGSGNGLWLAAGGFNVMTQVGKGNVASVLAGGANVLTKVGDGDLTAGMLGGANVITHISGDNETSNTTAVALGGANILTKKGKGNTLAVMGGGANVLTHVGDGTTTGVMVGGANILTKVGNGDTTGIMLGVGNVLTHVGDGQTLGVMGAAGNIFTKVGDGTSIAVMIGAGNIFTHVGEGNAWALMGGLGNVFTKVGNGDALALMVAEANVFTHIGDGMSVALMLAKGNVATKVGNGTTLAAMVGNANIFTHVGSGSTFAAMIGQANIMTKVGNDLTAALMVGKANIYTHVGDGTSLGIFAGEVNVMTKVGNGTTLAAMFGKANIMTHVGDGLTGVLALGEANIVTKVGDDFMGVVAAAKANVVTHVGDATTAAVLAGKGNILTKVGEGTTVGLLISDIGNVMTHVGDGTTIGIAKGKANIITKVGDGLGVNVAWGQANVFTQVGDGDRYNFAKGEANIITKVGDGQEVSVVQGKANIITHVGNGDDYTGAWGKANVITKVGNGRNVVLAKGEANIVTQVGDGDSFNALWSKGNIVTKVGDGMQVTAAKGKANITTTVGDGLSVTAAYGDANINTKVGDGVSVNVAWGKYNINTKVGDGLNVAVMKGKANANIHVGDGLNINASYAQNNVAIKVGNGDFYSLAVASSNTSSNKLSALFDNIKQTLLGVGGSQAINYLVQGDEASSSGTQKGRGAIATPEITKLDGFQMEAIEEVGSDLGDSLTGSVTKVDTPDLNKMQNALDVDGSSDQTQAPNLIVNGDFEQGDRGWKSTHGVEASYSGNVYGVNGEGHGARVTELDTYTNTSLYQDLTDLTEGEVIAVSFDFAKRAGLSNNEGIEVLWNGEVVFSSSGDASAWQQKTLKLTAHAGSNRIEFKGTGHNDGLGYILDNVVAKSESSQQANAVSEHATQNQASQNALSDKERAEADRQRLEQEKQKQLDAVAGSQSQLESTDQQALENNGQAQRDAVKEESEAVTAELTKLAQGLDVLDGQATHSGESGDQWRNDFAGGLLDGVQSQLDDAKQLANDKIAAAKQAQSDNNSKVKESVAKSEAGVAKGEQNRAGAEQDIAEAKADAETRKADAVAKSNDAKQAESDAHSAANDAQSRGDRDAMNAENKANQAQNDAKGTKQNEGDRPDREGVAGSGLSGNAHSVEGAGETGSHVNTDSPTNADGRFSEGLSEQEQEALEGATNAVNRLQINAGIRGKNSGSTITSMFTETNSDSIVVPTTASQDVVRQEIRISGVNLEGLSGGQGSQTTGQHSSKSVPGFQSHFASTSIGIENELSGLVVVLPKNSAQTFGYVHDSQGNPLFMLTKDMNQGGYSNPAGITDINGLNNWQTHTIELVTYPSETSDTTAIESRKEAMLWLAKEFTGHINQSNHQSLPQLVSEDGRFTLVISNSKHLIAAGNGTAIEAQGQTIGMTPSGQQATMAISAKEFGSSSSLEVRLLESAPWYQSGLRDEFLANSNEHKLDDPEAAQNVYAYLTSVYSKTADLAKEFGIYINDWDPASEGFSPNAQGLTDPKVKNAWEILPRTKPVKMLELLSADDSRYVRQQIIEKLKGSHSESLAKNVFEYFQYGGEVAGHGINNATTGSAQQPEPAILFEFRSVPSVLSEFVPKTESTAKVDVKALDHFDSASRKAIIVEVNALVSGSDDFDAWYQEYRASKGQPPVKNPKSSASANHKAEWLMTQYADKWAKITAPYIESNETSTSTQTTVDSGEVLKGLQEDFKRYGDALKPDTSVPGKSKDIRTTKDFLNGYKNDHAKEIVDGFRSDMSIKQLVDLFVKGNWSAEQKGALAWEIESRALKVTFQNKSEKYNRLFREIVSAGVARQLLEKMYSAAAVLSNPTLYSDSEKANASKLLSSLAAIHAKNPMHDTSMKVWQEKLEGKQALTVNGVVEKITDASANGKPVLLELDAPGHAMAAWAKGSGDDRVYGFYDPNAGIVEFSSAEKFGDYLTRFFGKSDLNMAQSYKLGKNDAGEAIFNRVVVMDGNTLASYKPTFGDKTTMQGILDLPVFDATPIKKPTGGVASDLEALGDKTKVVVDLAQIFTVQELKERAKVFAKPIGASYQGILDQLDLVHQAKGRDQIAASFELNKKINDYIAEHPTSGRNQALTQLKEQVTNALFIGKMQVAQAGIDAIAQTRPELAARIFMVAIEEANGKHVGLTDMMVRWANEDPYLAPKHGYKGETPSDLGFDAKYHVDLGEHYADFKQWLETSQSNGLLSKATLDESTKTVHLGYSYQELQDLTGAESVQMAFYFLKEAAKKADPISGDSAEMILLKKFADQSYLSQLDSDRMDQIEGIYRSSHETDIDAWDRRYSGTGYDGLTNKLASATGVDEQLAVLLDDRKGLLIGEVHGSDVNGLRFVNEQMDALKKQGVTVIGLEHLRSDLAQPLIDRYLATGVMSSELSAMLKTKHLDVTLFENARANGMRIVALDANSSARPNVQGTEHGLMYRAGAANNIAVEVLQNLPDGEKFVAIYCKAHLQSHKGIEGFVPGITHRLDLPALKVSDSNQFTVEQDDVSLRVVYDDVANKPKITFKDSLSGANTALHNQNVNDWERVVVTPTADGGESRFDGQIIVQMENDDVVAKAAANLAGKHPESSVVVQIDSDGNYRVVYGDPSKLDGKLRWQLVGHGRDDSESNNTRLSGYSADELAVKLAKFQQSFNQAENINNKPDHISIVGCSLVSDDKQKGFGHQFINAMDANGLRVDVSVRSSELAVDEAGRKHTKDANGDWVQKAENNKVSLSWDEQGEVVAKDERIRNGIAEGDIDLSRIGVSDVDEPARGAIGDNNDVFDAPEKRKAETETSSSSANNKLSYSGNIQVNVGDGEFTAVNWGTSNVGIKVGTGGFKSLAFGDNNVMVHIGNGESKHSFDIGGYQALEGAQMFIGNRNVSFNLGRSNDLIVLMDKSIPTPPLVNPFDGAARISGVLQSIATSGEGQDWLAAQEQQWTLSGAKKFVKDMSGLDQSSSVDYTSLVELDSQNERSSRGLKHDAEAALNKQYNQWLSGNSDSDTSKLSRADKLRQANEKLAFNFAVGGQGADIQVTTGNWNFMFGDNIQSILDTNLGSLFGLMTQQFSATGQAKTTFTYTPEDLPRQLKNKLLGQLAGVGAETTLADIFGVDYTASGHIVSRNGEAVDGVAILKEMLEVIGEFSGDQLQAFVDPAKLLDSLKAGINMGADGIKSFAETHGLKEKAPEEEEDNSSVSVNGANVNSAQGATVADGSTETAETPDRAFGFNSLNLPNLFATIFSQDKQKEMKSLVENLKENLTADLLNMKEKTFDFLRNSGHLQGDGDINISLGNYNFNWGGDGKDLGAYLGDNNNFWGGRGDDVFYATGTSNIFTGGEGNDMGVLMGRENMMFGGDGNDTAVVAGRINHVFLGAGDDQSFVFGEGGEIDTGSGRDYVVTSGNFNRVDTGDDQDYSVTIGNNNQVELGAGNDFANVFGNYNRINASAGNDVVKLMGYHAVLNGGEGEDHLIAAAISKFSQFNGGEGRDLMVLGGYQNTFKGGTDVDSFVVSGDVIDNLVEDIRSEDNIVFNGIDWQKLWFERSGYDLKLSILRDPASDSDQAKFEHIGSVTFSDYFNGNRAQVIIAMGEKDATGEREYTTLSESAIDALVQAMSGFDPQAGDNGFIDNLDSKSRVAITTAWADVVHKKGITV